MGIWHLGLGGKIGSLKIQWFIAIFPIQQAFNCIEMQDFRNFHFLFPTIETPLGIFLAMEYTFPMYPYVASGNLSAMAIAMAPFFVTTSQASLRKPKTSAPRSACGSRSSWPQSATAAPVGGWAQVDYDHWVRLGVSNGGSPLMDCFFHGKSHRSKWMTGGTAMTQETST